MKLLAIEQYDEFYHFLLDYFPYEEVKECNHYLDLYKNNIVKIINDDFHYILTYFDHDDFIFIDYFAVNKELQGKGIGTKILTEFIHQFDKPIYLEVELPDDKQKQKRIKFYQRIGFHLNTYDYLIPAQVSKTTDLRFYLMSYPGIIDNYDELYEKILKDVYRQR